MSASLLVGLTGAASPASSVAAPAPRPIAATNEAGQVLVQPNGKAVVAGTAYSCGPEFNSCADFGASRAWITAVRFDKNGQIDRSFGGRAGRVALELPTVLTYAGGLIDAERLSDGKLLFVADAGQDSVRVARLTRNGTLDPNYGEGGIATVNVPSPAVATSVSSTGEVFVVATDHTTGSTGPIGTLVATHLTPQGATDQDFGTGGQSVIADPAASLTATALAPDAEGGLFIGGTRESLNDHARQSVLMRLEPSGLLDSAFGSGGLAPVGPPADQYDFAFVSVVNQLSDGRLSVAAQVGDFNATAKSPDCTAAFVAMLQPGGAPDAAFGSFGTSEVHPPFCDLADAVLESNGDTITLSFGFAATLNRIGVTGTPVTEFRVDKRAGIGSHLLRASPAALAIQADGGLLVGLTLHGQGRHFTDVPTEPSVVAAFSLARFNPDGSRDLRFGGRGLATWPHLKPKRRTADR